MSRPTRSARCLALVFVVACVAIPAQAQQLGRRLFSTSSTDTMLREINPISGSTISATELSLLQPIHPSGARGLAAHPSTGDLWAVMQGGGSRFLTRIDPATGEGEFINVLASKISTIAFDTNGTLYGVTGDGDKDQENLYTINTSTAAMTLVRALGNGNDGEAIAYYPPNHSLHHASGYGVVGVDEIFEVIDLITLSITPIPLIGPSNNGILALAYQDFFTYYAANKDGDLQSITHSWSSATVTTLGKMDHVSKGLAFGPATAYTLYSVSRNDHYLRTLHPITGATLTAIPITVRISPLALVTPQSAKGIAIDPTDGTFYLLLQASSSDRPLATLDPVTGQYEIIGVPKDHFSSIAFDGAGTLYGLTGEAAYLHNTLYVVSKKNAASTPLMTFVQTGSEGGRALAYNAADGKLYRASGDGLPNQDELFESIDLGSLSTTLIPLSGFDYAGLRTMTDYGPGLFLGCDHAKDVVTVSSGGFVTRLAKVDHHCGGLAANPGPGGTVYSVDRSSMMLRTIDPATGATLTIKPMQQAPAPPPLLTGVRSLAIDPTGPKTSMLGLVTMAGKVESVLAHIHPSGWVDLIADTEDLFTELAFDDTGTLYGVTDDTALVPESLFTIDLDDGTPTLIQTLGNGSQGESILFNPRDGLLYHASGTGTQNDPVAGQILESLGPAPTPVLLSGGAYSRADAMAPWIGIGLLVGDSANGLYTVTTNGTVLHRATLDHPPSGLAWVTLRGIPYSISRHIDPLGSMFHRHDPHSLDIVWSIPVTLPGTALTGARGLAHDTVTKEFFALLKSSTGAMLLSRLDTSTGQATLIGNPGDLFATITFDASGTLYGVTGDGAAVPETLYTLSTLNGAPTYVGKLGNGTGGGEAIGYNPEDDLLYHLSGWVKPVFETVDPTTMTVTPIGLTGDLLRGPKAIAYAGSGEFLVSNEDEELLRVRDDGACDVAKEVGQTLKGLVVLPGAMAEPYGTQCVGTGGFAPELYGLGTPAPGSSFSLHVTQGPGGSPGIVLLGLGQGVAPFYPGCDLQIAPLVPGWIMPIVLLPFGPGKGKYSASVVMPPVVLTPVDVYAQVLIADPAGAGGFVATNPLHIRIADS